MYTTTFYSFKGGVGRTMAMVNAAVDLAKRGRRVLAVDFDLEAPGLESFEMLRPTEKTPGIVDFVRRYLETGQAPDAAEFIYELRQAGQDGGGLWVMPAGSQKRDYGVRFRDIDWAELYEKHDGYLLFEDLKAQWEKVIRADWVLVDSRTGHTDTGGVCTRQLPDAVVVVFFPNEQNLRGLTKVVREIRAEAETPRKKQIALHFVMSNVPDLDDEDEILRKQIEAFRKELSMDRDPVIVHRYDSLALLNQAVFIRDRPKSRLASEYRTVIEKIVSGNLSDRDGALSYVRGSVRRPRWHRSAFRDSPQDRDRKLEQIEKEHANDGEVLYQVAELYDDQRRQTDAARLFDRAIEIGCREPDALLHRARARTQHDDSAGATRDAMRVLESDSAHPWQVREALELAAVPVETLIETVGIQSLDAMDRSFVGAELGKRGKKDVGVAILESIEHDSELPEVARWHAIHNLSLLYLSSGRCEAAVALLARQERTVDDMAIVDAFNYGMALWGATGTLRQEPFRRVVELARAKENETEGANFSQCLAVASWAVDESENAEENLHLSRQTIETTPASPTLSCWRYTEVSREEFLEDLGEIEALIKGDDSRKPRFMTAARSE